MKYLKKFDTDEQYEEYISSNDAVFPNVSLCTEGEKLYYNDIPRYIYYTATSKLPEVETSSGSGLHINAFNTNIINHTFSNGRGKIEFENVVTEIGDRAFYRCENLTSITIPLKVTSIGSNAFSICTSLMSISIPSNVTTIGSSVIYGCTSLVNIVIDSKNSVYDSRDNCNAIIETATNTLIYGCKNTIIPNSVTSIGSYAFSGCSGLESINIPESVTSIGNGAFAYCTSLSSIIISARTSPISTGDLILENTYSIEKVSVPDIDSWCYIFYNNTASSFLYKGGDLYINDNLLTEVIVPEKFTKIGNNTFAYCNKITSITLPETITSIGNQAFQSCSSLTSITIPNSVTSIGSYAFRYCSSLTSINIPNSITLIDNNTFSNCSSLASINIPNSVTSIGSLAFSYCSSLVSVTIPISVTSIGGRAFERCSSLKSVTVLASTPPTLSYSAFSNNAYNRKIYVPAESINTYKTSWSDYANYIEAIPQQINLLNDADNSTTLNTWNGVTLDVKLKDRTLYKDGYWNTICLPFSLSSLIGTPLEGAIVKKLNYSQYDAEQLELYIDFEDVNNIDAGTPYLIKWTPASDYVDDDAHNLVEPIFSGVTINNTLSPIETEYVDCIGTMSPVILEANDATKFYIGGDNSTYYPVENITINSLRIYFQLKKGLTASDMSINPNT